MLSAGVQCRTGLFPLSEIKPYLPAIADVYFLPNKEYLSIQQEVSENKTILLLFAAHDVTKKKYVSFH